MPFYGLWECKPCFDNGTCESHKISKPTFFLCGEVFENNQHTTQWASNTQKWGSRWLKVPIIEHNMPKIQYEIQITWNLNRMWIHQKWGKDIKPSIYNVPSLLQIIEDAPFLLETMVGTPGVNG